MWEIRSFSTRQTSSEMTPTNGDDTGGEAATTRHSTLTRIITRTDHECDWVMTSCSPLVAVAVSVATRTRTGMAHPFLGPRSSSVSRAPLTLRNAVQVVVNTSVDHCECIRRVIWCMLWRNRGAARGPRIFFPPSPSSGLHTSHTRYAYRCDISIHTYSRMIIVCVTSCAARDSTRLHDPPFLSPSLPPAPRLLDQGQEEGNYPPPRHHSDPHPHDG